VKVREELFGRGEGAGTLPLPVFLIALGDAAANGAALGRRVLVVRVRKFRENDDQPPDTLNSRSSPFR
jgi:hypothetical protein